LSVRVRRGWAFSPLGFARRVAAGAYEDNILFLASALTFEALLAALPFAILVVATLGFVLHAGEESVTDIVRIMDALLPGGGTSESVQRLEDIIEGVISSRTQLSLYGLPIFLWFATRLFAGARSALNEVFDTEESRSFFVGKGVDLVMVVVSLALVVANAVLTVSFANAPWVGRFVSELSTFAVGMLLFFFVYIVLPSRPIRWDTAMVAAAVAALSFEITKVLFTLYLSNFATFDRLLSNANAIAVLLGVLWVYYTAVAFLVGGEVAETYDLMRRQRVQLAVLA